MTEDRCPLAALLADRIPVAPAPATALSTLDLDRLAAAVAERIVRLEPAQVWLSVREVTVRTGRGRGSVIEALQLGLARRERGEALRPGELRGYQATRGGVWSVHLDDADAWVRGEAPGPRP